MAKKRIAADIDLCGNSVENVKDITASGKVTGNLDGALLDAVTHQGRVVALPFYSYTTLDMPTDATNDEYIQALLKKIVSEHSDLLGKTLVGSTQPNSLRNVILYNDPSGVVNDMPRYCSGVMSYGYSGEEYRFWINNGVFGSKTISDTNGDLLGARTDHSGNVISTTYATKSEVSDKVTKNDPTGAVAYEGNLKFGTGSVAGSVNPLDMALIQECGANRFAFLPPECITIEYSRDAGATWSDYGASDMHKTQIVTHLDANILKVGGPDVSNSNPSDANCRLRVTIKYAGSGLYANLHKFFAWVSTNGGTDCWWKIWARTNASASNESGWISITDPQPLSGWSGPNIINTGQATFGYAASQFGEIRFEFGQTGVSGNYYGLQIYNIFAYARTCWASQSEMAKTGHLYAYDYAQNATFPNGVKAKQFTGNLVGIAQKATQDSHGNTIDEFYAAKTDLNGYVPGETYSKHVQTMSDKTSQLSSDGSTFSGNAVNDGDGNKISETYAHGVSIYDKDGDFVETAKAIEFGYLKLQESEDIQVGQSQDSEDKKTIAFSLTDAVKESMGVRRIHAYGVPDSDNKIEPENRDTISQANHALNFISSDSVGVFGSSVVLDAVPPQNVEGIKISVRLAPDGGIESTHDGLKVSQLADGFYSAPKLILTTNSDATGGTALFIDHPCRGTDGVEFVLMNKSRRTRGGWTTGGYNHRTKHRKRGWTMAMNYRRAAMSYGIGYYDLTPCVLGNWEEDLNDIAEYIKKYYMYPFNVSDTDIDTTAVAWEDLYFGGWGMTNKRQKLKSFGIAARRLKNGKYEYSQVAVLNAHKSDTHLTFGVG